jgi:hypothetical protein
MKDNKIHLSIGGLSIAFLMNDTRMLVRLKKHYALHHVRQKKADFSVFCNFSKRLTARKIEVGVKVTGQTEWQASRNDFFCRWSIKGGIADIDPSVTSFDSCVRVIYATTLPCLNSVLVHSCGIAYKRKGYLFVGPSGYGKSTIARLSDDKNILSDEIVALHIDKNGKVFISATPLWGELQSGKFHKGHFPLKEILFLKKADYIRKKNIPGILAFPKLLRCVCVFSTSAKNAENILKVISYTIKTIPSSILYFKKNSGFWDLL